MSKKTALLLPSHDFWTRHQVLTALTKTSRPKGLATEISNWRMWCWNCDVVTCHTVVYPTYHDQDRVATRPKMIAVNCHGSTSTVSRAILKLVYQFGIPNSDPPTLKSVKISSSKNKQMTVQSHKSNVLSYSEYKITKIFWSFAPGTYWGGLTAPPVPDYPAAHWFFGSLCSSKNRHPQKIAGYATGPTGP